MAELCGLFHVVDRLGGLLALAGLAEGGVCEGKQGLRVLAVEALPAPEQPGLVVFRGLPGPPLPVIHPAPRLRSARMTRRLSPAEGRPASGRCPPARPTA